jgi:hypothetical protein
MRLVITTISETPGTHDMSDVVFQRIQKLLDNITSGHPLLSFVLDSENGGRSARKQIMENFLALLCIYDLKQGVCPYCYDDGPSNPKYDKKFNLNAHVWRCEIDRFSKLHSRCMFCSDLVAKEPALDAITHFEDCYIDAVARMNLRILVNAAAGQPPL